VDESVDRRPGRGHLLRRHAAARVEDKAKADRHALVAEVGDLLPFAVFKHGEIVLAEPRHKPPVSIRHPRGDVDEFDAAAKVGAVLRAGPGRRDRDQ
jgi:hypothetical protein